MLKDKQLTSISILYDKYAPAVYGAILRKINNVEIAEQILIQIFINIWDNPTFEERYTNHFLICLLNMAKRMADKKLHELNKGDNIIANLINVEIKPEQNLAANLRIS